MNPSHSKTTLFFLFLIGGSILFSSWLMFHTFSYDAKNSSMLIGVKAWSDFGAHIPLIRSFSLGNNWPPEYPLFPGEPIRYHFLFYFLVGMLEKTGLRIDWALNIPSVFGFTGLLILIAVIAQKLFSDKRVTILSLLFFLFNGSLSFLRFFKMHPISIHTINDIVTNTAFPSFAPWGPGEITAFWNLNIYTNQRHLAPAFALGLLFVSILLFIEKKPFHKQRVFLMPEIAILALLPYFHQPILLILAIFIPFYFVFFPRLRGILLLICLAGAPCVLPQLVPLLSGAKTIHWQPGYLIFNDFTFIHFFSHWFQNLGLHFFLVPLGWLIAPPKVKKIMIPLLFLFLIPNLFRFSVEMAANHKFFNFFLLFGNMLTAYVFVRIFALRTIGKLVGSVALIGLIFSGIIDFFPVYNDGYMTLQDIPANGVATWIRDITPPDAVFLNSSYFFHPASLAGRKIFMGWPYFAWSAGYDTVVRGRLMNAMYETPDTATICRLANQSHIMYMTIEDTANDPNLPKINLNHYAYVKKEWTNTSNTYAIISTQSLCNK